MAAELETLHLLLHVAQAITVALILVQFIQMYRSVRSRFNMGLIVFSVALFFQIAFAYFLDILYHTFSEIFLLVALIIFLYSARK